MLSTAPRPSTHIGPVGKLPFVIIVAVPYVHLFLLSAYSLTLSEKVTLVLVGAVYTAVGVIAPELLDRLGSDIASVAYFAFQIPLGIWLQYMSHNSGTFWLILLPLAGQSLFWFARRGMAVVASIIVVAFMLAIGLQSTWSEAAQSALLYVSAVAFMGIFAREISQDQTSRDEAGQLASELSEANRRLREFGGQMEDLATIAERHRLATAIHDSLSHCLTAVAVQLGLAQAALENNRGEVREALRSAQTLAQDGLADIRRSAAALQSLPVENSPLQETLATLALECQSAGIIADLAVHGTPRSLTPHAEVTLCRAALEGLANVRRHSHAARVGLTLDYRERRRVRLVVQDDGVGAAENACGFGLIGVRERAQLVGGEFRTTTAIGQGFTLEVAVPG